MAFKVVGVGEILWDLLLTGPQLGGAPANFAYHAHALGAETQVITRIGEDHRGCEIIRCFQEMGLSDRTVQADKSAPTGIAKVELSGDGLAHFTIQENVAWDYLAATPEALAAAAAADAVCFGSLAQRSATSRRAIQQLIAATSATALRVFDINLRQQFYSRDVIEESLKLANILKLNDEELPILAAMFNLTVATEHPIEHQLEQLAQMFSLQLIALTRGANGSLLYQESGQRGRARWSDYPSRAVRVVDTVGAGDSFTAAMVLGLLQRMDLDEINATANKVARYVCSQTGATPSLPAELAGKFGSTIQR